MTENQIVSFFPVMAKAVSLEDLLRWEHFLRVHPDAPVDLACLVRQARILNDKGILGNLT